MTSAALDLTGRVALVTGASSGLGAHFAAALATAGAAVVLVARREDRLQELRDAIVAHGGRALAVAADVADEASIVVAYDRAEAAFGTVDTVIANAGVNIEAPALHLDVAAFDEIFAINVRGVFLTAREAARRLIAAGSAERGHGRIVLISSITANTVTPGIAPYSGSKAAVVQMGRGLAREWIRRGINVNMILPGYLRTKINKDWLDSEGGKRQIVSFPRRRLVEKTDFDAMLLYLSSDASAAVTGACFTIDDGQSL